MLKKRKRSHLRRKRIPTSILLRSKLKSCPFKEAGIDRIDYKDVELLKNYVTQGGKIIPSRISGVCAANQRKLKTAIRRARNLALLSPMKGYVPQQVNVERKFSSYRNSKPRE
jgi:small subunit ribosomal protein S18|tara:strand:- start:585 stop:923 length:339 start_codon:yes stop_codon:yes gene_type:complete